MMNGWIAAVLGLGLFLPAQSSQKDEWLKDYQAARAVARQSGKPLFVVFR